MRFLIKLGTLGPGMKWMRVPLLSSFLSSGMVTLIMNRAILFNNTTMEVICERMAAGLRPRILGLSSIEKSLLAVALVLSDAERSALSF